MAWMEWGNGNEVRFEHEPIPGIIQFVRVLHGEGDIAIVTFAPAPVAA
jgi:hypothetical protein